MRSKFTRVLTSVFSALVFVALSLAGSSAQSKPQRTQLVQVDADTIALLRVGTLQTFARVRQPSPILLPMRLAPSRKAADQQDKYLAWGDTSLSDRRGRVGLDNNGQLFTAMYGDRGRTGAESFQNELAKRATSIVASGDIVYFAMDGGIYSLDLRTHATASEFTPANKTAEMVSEIVLGTDGRLIGIAPDTRTILVFATASGPTEAKPGRLLRPIQTVRLSEIASFDAFEVVGDNAYVIDNVKEQLSVVPLTTGGVYSINYKGLLDGPTALLVDSSAATMYVADERGVVALPLLVPATFFLEGGEPSEAMAKVYQYLYSRHVLSTAAYVIQKGDSIATIITTNRVLPAGYDDSIRPLVCALNPGFCRNGQYPAVYALGQRLVLPDAVREPYLARRELSLPIDFAQYQSNAIQQLSGTRGVVNVESVSRALNPYLSYEERTKALEELNYTYRGTKLTQESAGKFVFPLPGWKVKALVPIVDLQSVTSDLNRLQSQNLSVAFTVSPAVRSTSQSTPGPSSGPSPQVDPPAKPPWQYSDCVAIAKTVWSDAFDVIHYCLPQKTRVTQVAVIDNLFDSTHPAFKAVPSGTRLCFVGSDVSSDCISQATLPVPERHPISSSDFANFDSIVDHGTHVAGLVGAAAVEEGRSVGLDPTVNLYAGTLEQARTIFSAVMNLNLFNVSLGENPKMPQPGQFDDLKRLIQTHGNVLFVISAGDEPKLIDGNSLAGLGTRNNVIVVAASTSGPHPTIEGYSARGRDYVAIAAPGTRLTSTVYGGGYGSATGTSMATALVTGAAAILRGLDPHEPPYATKERLIASANLWENSADVLSGELDIQTAVATVQSGLVVVGSDKTERRCIGTVRDLDLKQLVHIQGDRSDLSFSYADLRRVHRNEDGSLTILYTRHVFDRNLNVEKVDQRTIERIDNVMPRSIALRPFRFNYEAGQEACGGETVDVRTVKDFVNVVYY